MSLADFVATVPTACGIETMRSSAKTSRSLVATVPTACGIETSYLPNLY